MLQWLDVSKSTWYWRSPQPAGRRGRPPVPVDRQREAAILKLCKTHPYWGYKRIAVIARRDLDDGPYSDRLVLRVMRAHQLLQRRTPRRAELVQARRLFELLPTAPNELWQMDLTYVIMPGGTWWYIVTVIDYHSRYLLGCHLTPSQSTLAVLAGLDQAVKEATRVHGPLTTAPTLVTDNGSAFMAKAFKRGIKHRFEHVRIQYRTPQQLGLLERFHATLKREEIYWNVYASVKHARRCLKAFQTRYNRVRPHWALRPAPGEDPLTPADVYGGQRKIMIPRWQGWARAALKKLESAEQIMDADGQASTS